MAYMNDGWKMLYTQITNSRSIFRHVIETNNKNNDDDDDNT